MTYLTPSVQHAIKVALAETPAITAIDELTVRLKEMGWRNIDHLNPKAIRRFSPK